MTSTSPSASAWYFTAWSSDRVPANRIPYAARMPGSPSSRPMKSGEKPAVSSGAAPARSLSVRRPYRSAVSRRTAMAYVFWNPSGASQDTPHRSRNSLRTRRSTAAGSAMGSAPRMATSPVPVYSG